MYSDLDMKTNLEKKFKSKDNKKTNKTALLYIINTKSQFLLGILASKR